MHIERNKVFIKESIFNYIYQFIFISINFILVPITISYLGNIQYGALVLLLSIVSWMNIADFGLGNGLRNRIAQNYNITEEKITAEYVSSAFFTVGIISLILLIVVGTPLLFLNDLSYLLNEQDVGINYEIKISLLIIFIGFCINFMLGIYKSVANGIQKSSWTGESQAINSILLLIFMFLLLKFLSPQLIYVAFAYVISSILSNLALIFRIIRCDPVFIPNIKLVNKNKLRDILTLGFGFFILQICMIVIFSTDNLLITKLFGLKYVTEYSIIDKVFAMGNTLFAIVLIATWSGVTKAYEEKDYTWIKKIIQKIHFLFFLFVIGVIFVGVFFNTIAEIWIGSEMKYSYTIISLFTIYTILSAYGAIFVNIMNGLGKIKLQIYIMIFAAIVNIPLSIILGQYFGFGIAGIKLGTMLSLLPLWVLMPLQVYKILHTIERP